MLGNFRVALCVALLCLPVLSLDALYGSNEANADERIVALREDGKFKPRVKVVTRNNPRRWETTISARADDTGFHIQGRFENIAKLQNHTLCAAVMLLDSRERVLSISPLMRRTVQMTRFFGTQIEHDFKEIRMAPEDMMRVHYALVWHERCPRRDNLEARLREVRAVSDEIAKIAENWAKFSGS